MQISVLIPVLLQAAASTLAANVGTTGSHNSYNSYNSYNCTAMSDEHSEYCCVQFRSYPGDLNLHPDVELYNYAHEILTSSQVTYDIQEPFDSDLCYTVDVTANLTNSLDGKNWVDDSNFWYVGTRYGAYATTAADLAMLTKATTTFASEAALTAAYWFNCSASACDQQRGGSTTCSAAASARAMARSF